MTPKYIDGLHKREPGSPSAVLIPAEQTSTEKTFEKFEKPVRKKISTAKVIFFILVIVFILTSALYISRFLFYQNEGQSILSALSKINIFKEISNLITSADKKLAGEQEDRINFLLLGIGGESHPGPYLTDTIILASFKPSQKRVFMVSLPRDLLVKIGQNNWQKINSLYTIGRQENKDDGLIYTKEILENNLALPIHYYFLVDFDGFKNIIDFLNGIEVEVDRSFTDNLYPLTIDPPSWQTVSFEAGLQKMDGDQALKFARSRHGNNGEGSDFARAKRQQKIILAIKDKVFSFETLLRPTRVSGLFTMLDNYFQTNLKAWEVMKLYDLLQDINDNDIVNFVLDDGPNNYLYSDILEDGAYVLLPKGGNFSAIQNMLDNIFETTEVMSENTYVDILNGTTINGLAYQNSLILESLGLKVNRYTNAPTQDYQTSIIYDLTNGEKDKSLEIIKEQIGGYITTDLPYFLQEEIEEQKTQNSTYQSPDFIIILGQDQIINNND